MKIKTDFVTNSSSTSFCVWGIQIDMLDDEYKDKNYLPEKLLRKSYNYYLEKIRNNKSINPFMRTIEESNKDAISFEEFCTKINEVDYTYTDYVVSYLNSLDIDSMFSYENGGFVYIGRSPFNIKDDETSGSFKEILKLDLINVGFEDPNLFPIYGEVDY
jgi:hypothetical protein